MTIQSMPAPAKPPAFDVAKLTADIAAFRKGLPDKLRADFDQVLNDLAGIAQDDIDRLVKDEAGKALGGMIGGIVASNVNRVVNAGLAAEVKAIES